VSEESVERVRQLFFAVRRNLCAKRVVDWKCRLCVEDVAKETGNEVLSSSLGAVSSLIFVHDV
jgi:hypothetical protein